MSPETWKKVKSIFNKASELPNDERTTFIAQFDDEIRLEVEKMLAAVEEESLLLNEPIVDFNDFEKTELPEKIGDYKIVREVGHGGMGTVYEALRETENFKQRVALKVIKRGMNNDIILKRFRSEQQILASLEHPNIGRFLDGGKTADGLPFYAMEFIEGVPIDEFCRQKNLEIEEKVNLFRQVCSAVSYAHTNLIVHRDLKPSNIIVTENGTPKLLDFGIAKVLDVDNKEVGTATQLGMMTPQYASPEQIRGEKVTTLSDVYSLGIIFYEILTGEKPYETVGKNYAEILEIITQTTLTKPSENPHSAIRIPQLKGDLDIITLKSLQKSPKRRYQSVQEFSEDLRRHLVGLPIMARPDTFNYRLSKFVERNKVGVAAGALVLISLLGGIGVASWQAYRAEKQRLLAEKRFAEVRTIANNVVFKYTDEIAKLNGSIAIREAIVKDTTVYLDKLSGDSEDNANLQRELALAYLKLGDLQGGVYQSNLGDTKGADESFQKALNLLNKLPANSFQNAEIQDAYSFALLQIGRIQIRQGKAENALENLNKSLGIMKELSLANPDSKEISRRIVQIHITLGDAISRNPNRKLPDFYFEAQENFQKALELSTKLTSHNEPEKNDLIQFGIANQRIGNLHYVVSRSAGKDDYKRFITESVAAHQKSIEAFETVAKVSSDDFHLQRTLADEMIMAAPVLAKTGNINKAVEYSRFAEQTFETLSNEDPKSWELKYDLAMTYYQSAVMFEDSGKFHDAILKMKKSVEILKILSAENIENKEIIADIHTGSSRLRGSYINIGNYQKALSIQNNIDENLRKEYGQTPEYFDKICSQYLNFAEGSIQSKVVNKKLAKEYLEKAKIAFEKSSKNESLTKLMGGFSEKLKNQMTKMRP